MQYKIYPLNTNYLVYDNGDIINITTKRKLKSSKQVIKGVETGYIYVSLLSGSSKKWLLTRVSLHRVLLEWSTIAENIQHSYDNGRETKKGAEHWKYGKEVTAETRLKMSLAKQGDKHPKRKAILNRI